MQWVSALTQHEDRTGTGGDGHVPTLLVDHSKVFANTIKQSKVALSKVFLPQRYSVRMPFAFLAVAGVADEIIANCRRRHTTVWPYVSVLMESSPLGQAHAHWPWAPRTPVKGSLELTL